MTFAGSQLDYIVSPGDVLDETLEARGISKQEFAERCGRTPKFISEIIAGKAALSEETALQFGHVLDMDPELWTNLEQNYRLKLAQEEERLVLSTKADWVKTYPISDMVKKGLLQKSKDVAETARGILDFFGVASVEALDNIFSKRAEGLAYRRSASFQGHPEALMTWLRWGERIASETAIADYDQARFRECLKEIRCLTTAEAEMIQQRCVEVCATAGVHLIFVPELPGTRLSGATRWVGNNPVIQLSLRHKSDDHLWFTFFHEAGHVLLHGKKGVFIDDSKNDATDEQEIEANEFASNILIPAKQWSAFVESKPFTEAAIKSFAEDCGIAPGVIVGRLQHEGRLPFATVLNKLKKRFEWSH